MTATEIREALGRGVAIREELVFSALELLDPLDLIVEAARAYLDLLDNGREIEVKRVVVTWFASVLEPGRHLVVRVEI